jgi:hypothetical protein
MPGRTDGVVEELAVKDCGYTPVLVSNWLLPVRQSDDTKPARPESNTRPVKITFFVGTAVKNRLRHPLHDLAVDDSLSGQIHNTSDPAHNNQPLVTGWPVNNPFFERPSLSEETKQGTMKDDGGADPRLWRAMV